MQQVLRSLLGCVRTDALTAEVAETMTRQHLERMHRCVCVLVCVYVGEHTYVNNYLFSLILPG